MDRILLSVFEFNVLEVIKQSSQNFESWWFAAHLTDLLHHAGVLCDADGSDKASNLREFLILEYASSLASYPGMWQFAMDYFDHCPVNGRLMLEAYLERVPLTSERMAMQVLHAALQRDLQELGKYLRIIRFWLWFGGVLWCYFIPAVIFFFCSSICVQSNGPASVS